MSQISPFVPSQNSWHATLQAVCSPTVAGSKAFVMGRALKAKATMYGKCIFEDVFVLLEYGREEMGGNSKRN